MNTIKSKLESIFKKYSDKRICVLGTTCCGKTTLQHEFSEAIDMDEALWPTLSEDEEKYICSKPWTNEIGIFTSKLVKERVAISAGHPLFSLILLDCDVIVYLNISDKLLKERCIKRQASFEDSKNVKKAIESSIDKKNKNEEIIYIEICLDEC